MHSLLQERLGFFEWLILYYELFNMILQLYLFREIDKNVIHMELRGL
jgi:hypothetical protein